MNHNLQTSVTNLTGELVRQSFIWCKELQKMKNFVLKIVTDKVLNILSNKISQKMQQTRKVYIKKLFWLFCLYRCKILKNVLKISSPFSSSCLFPEQIEKAFHMEAARSCW